MYINPLRPNLFMMESEREGKRQGLFNWMWVRAKNKTQSQEKTTGSTKWWTKKKKEINEQLRKK